MRTTPNSYFMFCFSVSMGFFDDILITADALQHPSRLYPWSTPSIQNPIYLFWKCVDRSVTISKSSCFMFFRWGRSQLKICQLDNLASLQHKIQREFVVWNLYINASSQTCGSAMFRMCHQGKWYSTQDWQISHTSLQTTAIDWIPPVSDDSSWR